MKVLLVHNNYSSRVPSGENLVVHDEKQWLRDAGIDVHSYEVTNDAAFDASIIQKIGQATSALWSISAQRRMANVIDTVEPDIVHIHNLFPLLSASVPWIATRRNLPVVWTVHNHRVVCVAGTNFRDGELCHLCKPGSRLPGVRYACYGGSTMASALVTGATSVFRNLARKRITTLAVSENVRQWLLDSAGFSADNVHVKYNGIAEPPVPFDDLPRADTCRTFLFAAKLDELKGVSLLLEAWNRLGDIDAELRVVGSGPLSDKVRAAAATNPRITWQPQVPAHEIPKHLAEARAVLVPSTWEEPLPRTACEALAYGRPVITTGLGGLGEIVTESSGWITGTDREALTKAIAEAADSDKLIAERGLSARERYEQHFSPKSATNALIKVYENAIDRSSS